MNRGSFMFLGIVEKGDLLHGTDIRFIGAFKCQKNLQKVACKLF